MNRKATFAALCFAGGLGILPTQVGAQEVEPSSVDAPAATSVEEAVVRRVGPGTIDQPVQLPGPTFQLTAGGSGSEAAFNFKFVKRYRWVDLQSDAVRPTPWSFDLKLSTPLSKNGGYSDVGTIDKFVGSSKATLGISRSSHPPISSATIAQAREQLVRETQRACRLEETASGNQAALKACGDVQYFRDNLAAQLNKYKKDGLVTLSNLGWDSKQPVTIFGAEFSVGYNEYEFFDGSSLTKDTTTHVPYGAKAYFSWLPFKSQVLFNVAGEYQHGWKEGKKAIVCPAPSAAGTPVTCINGAIGAPKQEDAAIVSVGARGLLANKTGVASMFGKIGTALTLSYDIKGEQFAADLPIYLIPDDKGALRGGVRFGYKAGGEEKSDFAAALFIGAAFDIFK